MPKKTDKIIKNNCHHLILCEGRDAFNFLIYFLNYAIDNISSNFNDFCVHNFGGITELTKALSAVTVDSDFKILKSISIVRDAEINFESAAQSIQNSFCSTGFSVPTKSARPTYDNNSKYPNIKTGFILFPSCTENAENGTLENFCLKIFDNSKIDNIKSEVDSILNHLNDNKKFVCPHKNTLHTYLSLTNEFVGLKIGEAAKANAFLWNSPHILPLQNFFESMLDQRESAL